MGFWGKLAALGELGAGGALLATGAGAPAGAALLGAGIMSGKHEFVDIPKENREREVQGEMTRYSPWTGIQGHRIAPSDSFGPTLQGGLMGYMAGNALGAGGSGAVNPATGRTAAEEVAMNADRGTSAVMQADAPLVNNAINNQAMASQLTMPGQLPANLQPYLANATPNLQQQFPGGSFRFPTFTR